jgi:hypothetical protein
LWKQYEWKRQRLLRQKHFQTFAVLWGSLPVPESISNEVKQPDGCFACDSKHVLYFVVNVCCVVSSATCNCTVFQYDADRTTVCRFLCF